MDDRVVAALARGLVPFVRETVRQEIEPLHARLTGIEGHAIDKALVPAELAEQVAGAVRLLHEAPPIITQSAVPSRVVRIERDDDGNLVPIYQS